MRSPNMIAGGGRLRTMGRQRPAAAGPLLAFIVLILLPVGWIGLLPTFISVYQPASRTRAVIRRDNQVLHAFLKKYKKTPANLNVLRSFAHVHGLPFEAYDAYGQRLEYLRLDDKHYLLRSFGEDQVQNTALNAPDMGVVHWGERAGSALTYQGTESPEFYPAALLGGSDSPNKAWLARVFVDRENEVRHLLVRHLTKSGLFMVAPHDEVEEFFWLPGGQQLVFTGTSSSRYRDGVYVWDLRTDRSYSLFDTVKGAMPMSPAKGGEHLWLTLAGLVKRGPTVLVYQHQRHDGALSPEEFFTPAQLVAITLPEEKPHKARLANPSEWSLRPGPDLLHQSYELKAHLSGAAGLKMQRQWLHFNPSGEVETVLLNAQQLSDSVSGTPLFPYSLWLLSILYSQSFSLESFAGSPARDSLRAYGAEISRVLLNDPLAPAYLRGLALGAYGSLMEGQPLAYRISRLTLPSGGVTPAPAPPAAPKPP